MHVLKKLGPLGASSLLEHGEGGDFRGEGTKLRESHFRVWKLCGTDLRVLERCGIGFTVFKPEKRIHTFFKKKIRSSRFFYVFYALRVINVM